MASTAPDKHPGKPLRSWTKGSQKEWERRENGMISPRQLYGRGEWALRECEEHTTWANNQLRQRRYRLISDLRKSIGDGLTLVHLLEVLTNEKIPGVQSRPIIRAQKAENLQKCLQFLDAKGVRLYGITVEGLADGNLKTILNILSVIRDKFEVKTEFNGNENSQDNLEDGYTQRVLKDSGGYSTAFLPGTMAAPHPENNQSPPTDNIMSTTQLDKRKVEQHGADQRRQQLIRTTSSTVGPQPDKSPPTAWSTSTPNIPAVRDTVSLTVEERLKTLLDSPNLGGLAQQGPQDYIDGELIQPPPPPSRRTPVRYGDDDDDRRVQAMFDGTVKYNVYSGEWNDYGSSYVPSHVGEKKDGPRGQTLLERPKQNTPASPRQNDLNAGTSQQVMNYNHAKTPSTSTTSSSEPTSRLQTRMPAGSSTDNLREACNMMYSGAASQTPPYPRNTSTQRHPPTYFEHIHRHPGAQPDWRNAPPSASQRDASPTRHYQRDSSPVRQSHPRDSSPVRQSHLRDSSPVRHSYQRHSSPVRQSHQRDSSPIRHSRPRETSPVRDSHQRDPSQHFRDSSPVRQPQDYRASPTRQFQRSENNLSGPRGQDGDLSRQNETHSAKNTNILNHVHSTQKRGYEQDHRRMEQYQHDLERERVQHQRPAPTQNALPMNRLASQDSNYSTLSYNSITDSMTSAHTQMSFLAKLPSSIKTPRNHGAGQSIPLNERNNPTNEGRIDLELNYTPSESSSRSHTPPLPALSPDNTPPITPPESPLPLKHSRSHSVTVTPSPFELLAMNKAGKSGEKKKKSVGRSSSTQMRLYPHGLFHKGSGRSKQRKRFERSHMSAPIQEYPRSEDSIDDDTIRDSESITLQVDTQDSNGLASESMTEDSTLPMHYDADSVRHQLIALEKMYQDILHVIGANRDEKIPNSRFMGSQQSLHSRGRVRGSLRRGQREKDIKLVNKRFARVESHVVTLARSVAHLSSELRSQNSLMHEIEYLKREVQHLKELQMSGDFALSSGRYPGSKSMTPSSANSHKVKKLTKFFGEEPPLLAIFLKQLGYEKYVPNFEKEKVGIIELPFLSEQRLERLGIPTGPRLRIMHEAHMIMS